MSILIGSQTKVICQGITGSLPMLPRWNPVQPLASAAATSSSADARATSGRHWSSADISVPCDGASWAWAAPVDASLFHP